MVTYGTCLINVIVVPKYTVVNGGQIQDLTATQAGCLTDGDHKLSGNLNLAEATSETFLCPAWKNDLSSSVQTTEGKLQFNYRRCSAVLVDVASLRPH